VSTKTVLRNLKQYNKGVLVQPYEQDQTCLLCGNRFTDKGLRFRIKKPNDVCLFCWRYGKETYMNYRTMKNALEKLANLACLKDGEENCTCATCYAGQVLDKVFPEPDPSEPEAVTVLESGVNIGGGGRPLVVTHDAISYAAPTESETWKKQHWNPEDGPAHYVGDGCFPQHDSVQEQIDDNFADCSMSRLSSRGDSSGEPVRGERDIRSIDVSDESFVAAFTKGMEVHNE
jgi:hypothetical protein